MRENISRASVVARADSRAVLSSLPSLPRGDDSPFSEKSTQIPTGFMHKSFSDLFS